MKRDLKGSHVLTCCAWSVRQGMVGNDHRKWIIRRIEDVNIRHNSNRINLSKQKTGRTNEIPCNERPSRESPHTLMQIIETDPPSSGHYMPAGFV